MKKQSKGVVIFCWIVIFYSSLTILWVLYMLTIYHLPSHYLPKIAYMFIRPFFFNLFPMIMAVLLLRLNDLARKIFIISATILAILNIYTSISYSQYNVPQLIEKSNQEQIKLCEQKGESPKLPSAALQYIVFCIFLNLARLIWVIIYITGVILFTRPEVREQFKLEYNQKS